ncbi:MAG TPA: hypothetical protein VG347_00790 [Verrucomicrobiae bacterium]|nr:hypothetical protein [Verrucomicrobiae bacterium]
MVDTRQFVFPCPQCGVENSGNKLQVHRGLKCSACGTGYIPVKIETKPFREKDNPWFLPIAILVIIALALLLLPIWLDLWLVPVLLLAAILITLLRKK